MKKLIITTIMIICVSIAFAVAPNNPETVDGGSLLIESSSINATNIVGVISTNSLPDQALIGTDAGDTIDNPVIYTGTTVVFDAYKPFAEFTPSGNFTATWTNSTASVTNTWDIRIELIGADAYTATWNITGFSLGDGTIEGANEAIAVHGSFTNAINGFELDGDL